jgi:hypothetical protein
MPPTSGWKPKEERFSDWAYLSLIMKVHDNTVSRAVANYNELMVEFHTYHFFAWLSLWNNGANKWGCENRRAAKIKRQINHCTQALWKYCGC